jgi:hypothetical protein
MDTDTTEPSHQINITDIFIHVCRATCPVCLTHNYHTVGPPDAALANRSWGDRVCDGCSSVYTLTYDEDACTVWAFKERRQYRRRVRQTRAQALGPLPLACIVCDQTYKTDTGLGRHTRREHTHWERAAAAKKRTLVTPLAQSTCQALHTV